MKHTGRFLIYGATGFTGKLTARTAKERGLSPILAGRNASKLVEVARPLGFECSAFELSDARAIDAELNRVDVVLHIAGPFSATSRPMADACLRTGTHYLDITGEIDVFEALAVRDEEARNAGIMLMPGVGFDVVPSDCLAAHLKRRLPDAIDLKIDIGGLNAVSHGTMESMVESIPNGARVRRDGRIVTVQRPVQTSCDFGEGAIPTLVLPWGDVSTAYYSTGIKNIEVRMASTPQLRIAMGLPEFARRIAGMPFVQSQLKALIARMPEGPSDEVLRTGRRILVGVVSNARGEKASARVTTGQGNALTAQAGVEIARRVIAGEFAAGFQTPSLVYGPDFILQLDGTSRQELDAR